MKLILFFICLMIHILYTNAYLNRYTSKLNIKKKYFYFTIAFITIGSLPLYNVEIDNAFYTYRASIILFINFLIIFNMFEESFLTKLYILLNYYVTIFVGFIFYVVLILDYNHLTATLSSVNRDFYYELSYLLSYLTAYGIFLFFRKKYEQKKIIFILRNKKILSLMLVIQLITIINSVLLIGNNQIDNYIPWTNHIITINALTLYITYVVIYILLINVAYLSTYKFSSKILEGQLKIQIDHYRLYENHMQSMFKFKHDYQKIITALMIANKINENPTISRILNSSQEELSNININYKKYSDNYIMDALLNHYESKLKLLGVHFKEELLFPIRFNLKEYDLVKLFSNLFDNSIEALSKLKLENRRFNITTFINKNYQTIVITNSSLIKNIRQKTTKKDKIKHGYGLTIIGDIIEKYDGLLDIQIDIVNDLNFFKVIINLPLDSNVLI